MNISTAVNDHKIKKVKIVIKKVPLLNFRGY